MITAWNNIHHVPSNDAGKIWDADVEPGWYETELIKKSGEVAGTIKLKPGDGDSTASLPNARCCCTA